MGTDKRPSIALLAANERLLTLRDDARFPRENDVVISDSSRPCEIASREPFCISPPKGIVQIPTISVAEEDAAQCSREVDAALAATTYLQDSINIFGHTLDAIARAGREGDGRVWLLARYLDKNGEGRVAVDALKKKLVTEWNVLSWKRLRQIMNAGEGVFWHRDKRSEHCYYHSEARVAKAFDVGQLRGFAVAIPIRQLLGNIKSVRAVFYDAFHSGRTDGYGNPITRHVMETRGNGDGRTQREYEELRGIDTKANYVNVGIYNKKLWEWEKGREDVVGLPLGPAFRHVDFDGRLGHNPARKNRKKGQQHWHNVYIMRRMANSYRGTLQTVKRGRRWTNQKLENLCHSMHIPTGSFETYDAVQIYHDTEQKASRFQRRKTVGGVDAYFPQVVTQDKNGSDFWRVYGVS